MSLWRQHDLGQKVRTILEGVHAHEADHPLGPPFISGYQLAIELERLYPDTVRSMGRPIGGSGAGAHHSLSSYLAGELVRQIRSEGAAHPVEGALLWRGHTRTLRYRAGDGSDVESTVADAGYDLALFRLRQ